MPKAHRSLLWILLLQASLGGVALAQASHVAVHVDVRGGDPCAARFLDELKARDPNIRAAQPGERAPRLLVHIEHLAHGGERGRLIVQDSDGLASQRSVDGDTCESVLGALALMSAVAVDPSAPVAGEATTPEPLPGKGGATPGLVPSPTESSAGPAVPAGRSTSPALDSEHGNEGKDEAASEASPERSTGAHGVRIGFSGGVGMLTGSAPTVVVAVPVEADVRWGDIARFGPLIRVGYLYGNRGSDTSSGGSARFVLNAATVDGCAHLPLGSRIALLLCLHAEGGILGATGVDVTPARSNQPPWLAVGLLAAVRYRVVSVFFIEADGGLRLPLIRDTFYFEPDTTVFRPPPFGFTASASLGVTIP